MDFPPHYFSLRRGVGGRADERYRWRRAMQGQDSQQRIVRYVPQLPPRVRLMRRALAGLLLLVTVLAGGAGEARADKLVSNLTTLLDAPVPA